jgi:Fur family ferric uptake transcriptional regulator/Fur family peroxide stress response transcriptional regulator
MTDQHDLRFTPQRRAVLDVLRAATDHPTAAEVYDRVRAVAPGIGPATVYRALGRLVETGRALELTLGNGAASRYDANTGRHDHAVCVGCGRAVDIDLPVPADALAELCRRTGFTITGYDLQFRGLCPACQTSGSEPARTAAYARASHGEGTTSNRTTSTTA